MARGVKPYIAELVPYQPGKPLEELERELGLQGSLKLASNENPLGPSPKALAALRGALTAVHRYPDGACFALRSKLADRLDVDPRSLVFGCGADEILELVVKAYVSPGDEVVYAWPSFAMYPIVTRGMGASGVAVPLDADYVHDLDAMAEAVGPLTQLAIVCNPNNPTGTSVGDAALGRFLEAVPDDLLVVVDEAYAEYARRPDFPDALGWVRRRPRTLVMRTFSKIYGLAGLRVGWSVSDLDTAGALERARHPFNVNRLAEVAACAALDDDEHVERSRRVNAEGIEYLVRELAAMGIEVWPSDANFVLARSGPVYDRLLREGVIVRPLASFGLPDCVRITVGAPEENERVVKALRRLREAGS
jgi:histidinol-phosphate aminotransferase